MNRQDVREHLTGPIDSVRVPFLRDGSVDYQGLRNVIEFDIQAGSKTVLLTVGDSHYLCLSDQEIGEITRVAVEQTRGRAMLVAADRMHATARAVEFARFAKETGADVVMCLPPDWAESGTSQSIAEHYVTVSKVMPVMIVTGVFIPRGLRFALDTVSRALAGSQSVVAVKDDMCGQFAVHLSLMAHPICAVFAGGLKVNHMTMHPYGCDGYMSSYITFRPEIAWRYWDAITKNDLPAAAAIIRDYDIALFDLIASLPGGFDAGMHGIQEVFGIAERWRRPPYYSLNDAEMERLKAFFEERGIAP